MFCIIKFTYIHDIAENVESLLFENGKVGAVKKDVPRFSCSHFHSN